MANFARAGMSLSLSLCVCLCIACANLCKIKIFNLCDFSPQWSRVANMSTESAIHVYFIVYCAYTSFAFSLGLCTHWETGRLVYCRFIQKNAMIRLINRLQQYAISRCNNIAFYCIDFIFFSLHFDSREKRIVAAEKNAELKKIYDLLFVYADCWRSAVATAFYFIMHCMNQARQNYIVLVTSLLFLFSSSFLSLLSFVSFYCLRVCLPASLWIFKKRKKSAHSVRTMITILWCRCCWCNCCIKRSILSRSSSVSLHILQKPKQRKRKKDE